MSGGRFNYMDSNLCNEIFDYGCGPQYNLASKTAKASSLFARKLNPLDDEELSELLYDMFCILHSFDWAASGDTGYDDYRKDVAYFKNKWLKRTPAQRTKEEIDKTIAEARDTLYRILIPEDVKDGR